MCVPNKLNAKLFPFPFPLSCHSVMWALRQKFFLIFIALKMWCLCLRAYILYTRVHSCICFTYVPPCVISLLIQRGGAESALHGPHNAQTFFQLAGQVGLSGAYIYCKSDPDKTPTGSCSKGTDTEREREEPVKSGVAFCWTVSGPLMLQVSVWPYDY